MAVMQTPSSPSTRPRPPTSLQPPAVATAAAAADSALALSPGPRGPLGFRPALNLTVDVSVGQVGGGVGGEGDGR